MLASQSGILFFLVVIHGVYLERWDRIDYKRVKFLLADPRYPNLPSFATCVPTFEQPSRWTNFFGSRLRTYFVPFQTGNHYFFLCKLLLFLRDKRGGVCQISHHGVIAHYHIDTTIYNCNFNMFQLKFCLRLICTYCQVINT